MKYQSIVLTLVIVSAALTACNEQENVLTDSVQKPDSTVLPRWYTPEQVTQGAVVFAENCAQCHGEQAEGIHDDWRERLDDGSFPPPPLNGSAHAWHHPRSILLRVINNGGIPLGGQMPAFEDVLDEQEKLAAIAYFQDFWSDEIYGNWLEMGGVD
ncbi:MAG: cytochrome c [Gammaproteobacteria bacterium]